MTTLRAASIIERTPVRARPPIPQGPFLVAGLGRAGTAALRALRREFPSATIHAWDHDTTKEMHRLARRLEMDGIHTVLGAPPSLDRILRGGLVVKSPGVAFASPVIAEAQALEIPVLDELEIGWRLSRAPVLAVTGTNGKSTVSGLATAVLAAAGARVQLAGNTDFGEPLSTAARAPLDWLVCEVSSFQLEGSPEFLPEVAVFTNLTVEHLGRHRTLERYGAVKRRLFVRCDSPVARAVIDVDDAFGRRLADEIELLGATVSRVGFSADAEYRVKEAEWDLRRCTLRLATPQGSLRLTTALPGSYNARNIAAALGIAGALEVPQDVATGAVCAFRGPPGRFEHIDEGQPFSVIVDFAHSPDGIEQLLRSLRAGMTPGAKLRVVFGIGSRAGSAMREMGRLTRALADHLILTTSGFRGCPPLLALHSSLRGARRASGAELEIVLDRRRAIERALSAAGPDDVVAIPGRGAYGEMQPDPRGRAIAFDDRVVARELLRDQGVARAARAL
ncbi:MAG TPA: Mur ligase family protein [Solirubrobacteraceae bacterium]|nr:Mur ligase family protein [Solirubrobacteraceae bacterium]